MQQNWKFQRGDIFFTHFGASTGSEQHGDRPAVILQNDVGNYHSPTLIVATMTSKAEKKVNQPTHCLLENAGLNMPSVVQAEQIFTIDKSRALKYLGHLTPEEMRRVDDAVRISLALNPMGSMQLSDYRIGCVGTALKLYDQLGEEIYCEALRHIVEAWEGKPDSFRAAVLRGVMYFVQLYHGQYSEERLVRALSGVHPMELYRVSRDNPAKLPGWRRYVYPIYTTYNGKCRKDALPMKF